MNYLRAPLFRYLLVWMAGGALVGWLVAFLWWTMLTPTAPSEPREITIPLGAAAAIARGEVPQGIPSSLSLSSSGKLLVANHDSSEHLIAGTLVLPGDTVLVTPSNKNGEVQCTFHPGGAIEVSLTKRPPLYVTFLPAFMLGAPFGLAFGVATYVGKRLGMEDEPGGELRVASSD
jgi:hypothetical protein